MSTRYPIFVKRDIDGFFGLAVDNLVQMLLIVQLCGAMCGMTGSQADFITRHIMPGVAVSLLIGNLFYALQAHWVARRERRSDVTALPYGINTPSLLIYIFFVMMPAHDRVIAAGGSTADAAATAWRMGLIACLGSGLIEFLGSFVAERLRRNTPRAALLGTLAGIALGFISMTFALQIWQRPLVAMVPLAIVLMIYFSHARFPLGLPGGLVAIVAGTALAWGLPHLGIATGVTMSTAAVQQAWSQHGQYLPLWAGGIIWEVLNGQLAEILPLLSVIVPMGLFNVLGSLQNIESAEAGGDVFATGPSLAVNGLGTIAAALFGSCFPTTIYIGHPGWKAMGARAGYSTLNGLFITAICLTGTVTLISSVVPMEAGIAIVLWIGVVITAQAFQTSPLRHAPAVAIGLFPAIAAWGLTVVSGAFIEANRNPADFSSRKPATPAIVATCPASTSATSAEGSSDSISTPPATRPANASERPVATTLQELLESRHAALGLNSAVNGFSIHGLILLDRGYIFTCMILAAVSAFLIDRRYGSAAGWTLAAAVLTFLGLIHAFRVRGNVVDYLPVLVVGSDGAFADRAWAVGVGYLLMAGVFAWMHWTARRPTIRETLVAGSTIEDARFVIVAEHDRPAAPDPVPQDPPAR